MWTLNGNINELGNARVSLWKSYLFFWKSTLLFEVSGALIMVLEKPSEIVSHQVVPTTASGLQG